MTIPSFPQNLLSQLATPAVHETIPTGVVVVGAGVAGLSFALSLPESIAIALLTKGALGESNTRWAQGGLSAAIGADDSVTLHEEDTLAASAGLGEPETVHELVRAGSEAVDWLLSLGTAFDRDEETGLIALGREAAHSRRRVLHAGGDATGAEIERALVAAVRSRPNVTVYESAFAIDALMRNGVCHGLLVELESGSVAVMTAQAVVLAAGGAGQLWATTSNPPAATADGLAIAVRAGAAVADLEFCQFHPTVLKMPGGSPFLVSEAVRGEGAYLRGKSGERFMPAIHPLGELAPRDVVARGNLAQMTADGSDHVYLDLRHLDADDVRHRFPSIAAELGSRGLDLATELIPVAPAAHYFMGGVVADAFGRTTIPGLLAIGEAACTGVHGANRLASNSLLEGLVFGRKAGCNFKPAVQGNPDPIDTTASSGTTTDGGAPGGDIRHRIRETMSAHVSVVRNRDGLAEALARLGALALDLERTSGRTAWIATNMLTAGIGIATSALIREESRGAHFRADFPLSDSRLAGIHFFLTNEAGKDRWRTGSLGSVLDGTDA